MSDWIECRSCGDEYSYERWAIGYKVCLPCGDAQARDARKSWTIAPMNKSNYMLFTDLELLKQLNPKRTEV
jgi:ribosomal protein L37E|tara:strand:- start:175 stop:387 length:213 start_codon:yes stop_codon:yes gene_type:complete